MSQLFDPLLRARRRDRAAHKGPELFLLERAFADCLERLEIMAMHWPSALLLGCPDPGWKARLAALADAVDVADPGPAFAAAAGGAIVIEDRWAPSPAAFDLILAVGTLDTVDNLPGALRALGSALRPGGLLIGAMSGGDTVPLLRAAMAAADRHAGQAAPHVHPRIEASQLAPLLEQAGMARPVVDVDRVSVTYTSLRRLVGDLRAMAATNIMVQRPRHYLGKSGLAAAQLEFAAAGADGRSLETFEILHFAAWKPGG
jgi:NADH dehydrogenase [ubiquinone] 1 alpha subcomplex assembly factor 5